MSESGKKTHVMLVEDNDVLRDLLQGTLAEDYEVHSAANAAAAFKQLSVIGEIEVLITDFDLGGVVDGIDVAVTAHQQWPKLGVVFISGRSDLFLAKHAPDCRFEFLKKPFQSVELLRAVKRMSGR